MESARYSGRFRKLVVVLDIGTTFGGAAYALLDPGEVPQIKPVTKYPNTPEAGSGKVPSILYYDHAGGFCGVENGVDFQDEDEFLRVRWWKLMISTEPSAAMKDQMSTRLPIGKTIVDVFADFMGYLFESTKALFMASEPNGQLRWDSVSNSIVLVLTHPNGWGGPQQTQLRTAAVRAGIVSNTPSGRSSVHFVTEGEASFNFCVTHTQAGKDLKPGEQVLIIDAGGGTIDISAYTILNIRPLQVEELYEPKCLLQGGEFVTARARAMVQEKLSRSKFNTPDDLAAFSQKFDEGVKKVFSNDRVAQCVKFGRPRDNDPEFGIKAGMLMLDGTQVSEFFEPSIQSIVDSCIRDNLNRRLAANSLTFLVGGFAASPWFSKQLEKRLLGIGLKFCKPDTYTNKAVAVGAVSFYLNHFVTGRISKFTYGVPCDPIYQPSDPEHAKRESKLYLDLAGDRRVPHRFKSMLSRGAKVLEDRELRFRLRQVTVDPAEPASTVVIKYTGVLGTPEWMDIERDEFKILCNIRADTSTAPYKTRRGKSGKKCYVRDLDVILRVGLTELKAQIGWINSVTGVEERSDAMVIYDSPSEQTA